MEDYLLQQFTPTQSANMPKPATIASAATITPTGFLSIVTGTTQVANITPPGGAAAAFIALVFTNANPGAFLNSGNISATKDPAQNELVLLAYDPITNKWYVANP